MTILERDHGKRVLEPHAAGIREQLLPRLCLKRAQDQEPCRGFRGHFRIRRAELSDEPTGLGAVFGSGWTGINGFSCGVSTASRPTLRSTKESHQQTLVKQA